MLQNILWIRKEMKKKKIEKFNGETKKTEYFFKLKLNLIMKMMMNKIT